jgi:hypothetical protein
MAELVSRCSVAGDGRVGARTVDGLGGPQGGRTQLIAPRARRDRLASNPGRARSRSTSFRASSQRLTASGRSCRFWHRSKAGRSDGGAALGRNGRLRGRRGHARMARRRPADREQRCRGPAAPGMIVLHEPRCRGAAMVACMLAILAVGGCGAGHRQSDRQLISQTPRSYSPRPGCWRQGDGVRAAQRWWPEAAERARRQGGQGPGHQPAVVRRRGGPCPRGRRLAARERAEERPDRARPGSWRPSHGRGNDGTQSAPQRVSLQKAGASWSIAGVPALAG